MPRIQNSSAVRVLVGLAALAAACSGKPDGPPPRPAAIATEPEAMHRMYDFSPISDANPVVARVSGTPIEIPLSELQAFIRVDLNEERRAQLDTAGKRKELENLIDDHLLLWDAYTKKADQGARAQQMLENTRKMLLGEFLTKEEVDDKAKSPAEHARLSTALRDRLFSRASVEVSNEVHAELKKAAAARDPKADDLAAPLAERTIVRCRDLTLSAGEVWRLWLGEPREKRADLMTEAGLTELLKHAFEDALKVEEAQARGIDKQRSFRVKVQENRAAITRMWFQDQITMEAQQRLRAPDIEAQLHRWYQEQLATRYTYKDEKGKDAVVDFDAQRESIRNDYFDHLRDVVRDERTRRLREGHTIDVNDRLVAGA